MPDFQRMEDDPQPFDGDKLRRAQERHARCLKKAAILGQPTTHHIEDHFDDDTYRERHDDYG